MSETPWKGICCKACWNANGSRCRCKCKGQNHQRGHNKQISSYFEAEAKEKASKLKKLIVEEKPITRTNRRFDT